MISAMFGIVIVSGLVLVWIHDTLENIWKKSPVGKYQSIEASKGTLIPAYRVTTYQIPVPQTVTASTVRPLNEDMEFKQKIVHIDFGRVNRSRPQAEHLSDHVRVLSKAA